MNNDSTIKLLALHLGVGERSRHICPYCKAGHEKSFIVTRTSTGIYYNCYRVSCGHRGYIGSVTSTSTTAKVFVPKYQEDTTSRLSPALMKFLQDSYHISNTRAANQGFKYIRSKHRLYMPVYNIQGYEIGSVSKSLPVWTDKDTPDGGPKILTYYNVNDSRLHFPLGEMVGGTCIVVEDILSANTIENVLNVNACALLGTEMSSDKAAVLGKHFTNIVLALDPDATDKAIKMLHKYALYWGTSRVCALPKDPKDMTEQELKEIL